VREGGRVIRFDKRRVHVLRVVSLSWILIAWLAAARTVETQRVTFAEPEVKAVFLFNFAHFVQWPDSAFPDPRSAFVIGILGDDPFGRILDEVVKGEVVQGRRFVVERFRRPEDIVTCHILFVGQFTPEVYTHIFATLEGRPILTVGDGESFAAHGGVIRFLTDRNRIRLRVNVDAAKAARLTISSNVLRSADIVGMGR
jgi:hypothetical protein